MFCITILESLEFRLIELITLFESRGVQVEAITSDLGAIKQVSSQPTWNLCQV